MWDRQAISYARRSKALSLEENSARQRSIEAGMHPNHVLDELIEHLVSARSLELRDDEILRQNVDDPHRKAHYP